MQPDQILRADLLDILFEYRNKEYGAYALRKAYGHTLLKAIALTLCLTLALFVTYSILHTTHGQREFVFDDTKPVELVKEPQPHVTAPPPAPKAAAPRVKTVAVATPIIVNTDNIPDDQQAPAVDDINDAKIGTIASDGADDIGQPGPPSSDGRGVIEAPKKARAKNDDGFIPIQIESTYPGGVEAWKRYLNKKLQYPILAQEIAMRGTVMVQFVVDKEGNISDVSAISGPELLRAEAVRVIRKSGKWIPGMNNGVYVKSYKKQPITFRMTEEGWK